MNPYLLLGIGAAWVASIVGAFFFGTDVGDDSAVADAARDAKVAAVATDAAASAAAAAIAKLRPQITTIRQETEREVRTNTVYAGCQHSPEQLQRVNEALTGRRAEPAGRGLVPRADGADGPQLRGDNDQAGGSGGPVPRVSGSSAGSALTPQ